MSFMTCFSLTLHSHETLTDAGNLTVSSSTVISASAVAAAVLKLGRL